MNVSLYQAAAAMNANSRWEDVISENLASSSVPGFKKQALSLEAVRAGLMSASSLHSTTTPQFAMPKASTTTSFVQGEIQYTGSKNDVALEGKGFFQVKLPNGQTAVTRDGEFQVNSHGQLVTKEGFLVMGDGGPIHLDPNSSDPISISNDGTVGQGSETRGHLKLTDFDKPELLTQISGSYFLAQNKSLHQLPVTGTLREGYLETSNTSVVGEMANMMTSMRSFEANQKIIQMQDDRLGKTISELGNPN